MFAILIYITEVRMSNFRKNMSGIRMHPQSSQTRESVHHLRTSGEGLVQGNRELCMIYSNLMSIFLTSLRA